MSEPTATRCGCLTMQHPNWHSYRDSSEYEADHCQKHIEWERFRAKHEADCPKCPAVRTEEF